MKAALVTKIGEMEIREVEKPKVVPDSILIKIEACAICGSDLRIYKKGDRRAKYPQIIGHEIAGVIEETGGNVKDFAVGDRVVVAPGFACGECHYCRQELYNQCIKPNPPIGYAEPGGFAQYIVPPAYLLKLGFVNRIPQNLSFDEASLSEIIACCINGQEMVKVKDGDTVLIIGAGPAGCVHIELARLRGARKIIISQRSPDRLKMARKFRADIFIDPAAENLNERVLAETDGRGADVIIVAAPSREAQEQSLQMIAPRGRINFFGGLPHSDSKITIDGNTVHYKECFITGASSSLGWQNREALNLLAGGKIRAKDFISHMMPLEKAKEAMELVEKRQAMKVVIKPWT